MLNKIQDRRIDEFSMVLSGILHFSVIDLIRNIDILRRRILRNIITLSD